MFKSETTTLQVSGMTCGNCVAHVTKALTSVKGVKSADVQLEGTATVKHKGIGAETLAKAIKEAGYEVLDHQ